MSGDANEFIEELKKRRSEGHISLITYMTMYITTKDSDDRAQTFMCLAGFCSSLAGLDSNVVAKDVDAFVTHYNKYEVTDSVH